jgi:GAF domain-containing protein
LQHISTQLLQEGDVDALYRKILDAAMAIMRSDMASMQLLTPDQSNLRLLAWQGFDPAAVAFWEWVRVDGSSTCGVALRSGQRVMVPDVETCGFMAGTDDLETYRRAGIRAAQSTPLVSRTGRVLGMMSTHWREPHQPAERELRLLDLLVRQAADFIERAQAEGAVRQRTVQFEMLLNAAPLGVYLVDADFRIRQVNPTALAVFGDIPDLIGRDFDEVIHRLWSQAYADEIVCLFRHTLATGEPYMTPERSEERCDRGVTSITSGTSTASCSRMAATAWSAISGTSPPR